VFALAGCASSPSAQVKDKMQAMHAEETPDKLVARGKAFAAVGDLTRAEQYLSAALDAGADDHVVVPMLLRVCIQDRRYRAAIAYAQEFMRKHPKDSAMRFVLGTLEAGVGEVKAAKGDLEEVCSEQPDRPEAHYALAVLLRDAHTDLSSMDRHFREYLRLDPQGAHADEARAALLKAVPAPPENNP
jgi:Tfp pilus assembly protein PilF